MTLDGGIAPRVRTIAGFEKDEPRPLAALSDGAGATISFVENELIFVTDDDAALNAFARRWGGVVVGHVAPRDSGVKFPGQHLVRIDASRVSSEELVDDLKALNPGKSGKLKISSPAGRGLLAVASREAVAGRAVGINFVMHSAGYRDKNLTEGMPAPGSTFTRNPTTWTYFTRGPGTQNIGVGDAWRALDQIGSIGNRVPVAIIDGGFLQNDDNPANWVHHTNSIWAMDPNRANENECTNGAVCPWHGTNVVGAAMGVANNSYGAAGPAGPVADAITIRMSGDIFNYLGAFKIALDSGARVVNMSFGGNVPFTLSWSVIPLDVYTSLMRRAGVLLVAAAGNDGSDVDGEDCAWPFDWPCWERSWYVPCENNAVMCVGSLKVNSDQKLESSNYGSSGNVAMFGPGTVWVGPDLADQTVHSFSGTSAAAPFVAGVAALVLAANPRMKVGELENILYETANPSSDGLVRRYVNAYAAVIRAIGGTPPDITISVDTVPEFGSCRAQYQFSSTVSDPDNGPPTVKWVSDIDNVLGTGGSLTRGLSNGVHRITATATDAIGLSTQSNQVTVTAGNANAPMPTMAILSLKNHQSFAANQTVTLEAGGNDPNKALGGLLSANLRWVSSKDGELGWGQRIFVHLSPGSHFIFAYYSGVCGKTADDMRIIQVTETVADAPPNMHITTPSGNDLVVRVDTSGLACLRVAGFGFDEEDHDFATIEGWQTDRKDLQWKILSFEQNTTVCLKAVPDAASTAHEIRLYGKDRTGHLGISAPLLVTVLPAVK